MSVVGYYITCDDALCEDCFLDGRDEYEAREAWLQAGGFEGWDEPPPIMHDTESDTPTHCKKCGKLIPHALTSDGYLYVENAAREHIAAVGRGENPNAHSVEVVSAWLEKYDEIDAIVYRMHDALESAYYDGDMFDDEEEQ